MIATFYLVIRRSFFALLVYSLISMWASHVYSAESALTIESDYSSYNLNSYVGYYLDSTGGESIESIKTDASWIKNTDGDVLNFGFTNSPVWVHFPLTLSADQKSRWYLVIPYPLLQNAEIYIVSNDKQRLLWYSDLNSARDDAASLQSHNINFALPQDVSGSVNIYIKVWSSTSLQIPLEIWSQSYLIQRQTIEILFWGVYFGVIAALMIYNCFLFLSMRDLAYCFYVMALGSILVIMLAISGLGEQYLWRDPEYTRYVLPVSASLTGLWLLAFSIFFLHKSNIKPMIYNAMLVQAGLSLLVAFYVLFAPNTGALLASIISFSGIIIILVAGVSALMAGVPIARYFVLATTVFGIGAVLYVVNVFGFLPPSRITNHAVQVGSMLEALLLSFALAHRIKEERKHKLIAMEKMELAQNAMVQVQDHALQQALHDPTTKMPNDSMLSNRINQLIDHHSDCDSFALLVLYFPQLKEISSSMGRRLAEGLFGEIVTKLNEELSNDIQSISIEESSGSHLAVMEFGSLMLLSKTGKEFRSINDFAERILQINESLLDVGGISLRLKAYCGIALYPKHGDRADLLIQHACAARDYGLRAYEYLSIYSSEVDTFGRRRLALVGALAQAIKNRELEIHIQPQFECVTGTLCGAEVLARWNSETFGVVAPDEFIEVAEEAGLMAELTKFIVEEAFSLLRRLHEKGVMISLSINLSVQNLMDPRIVSFVVTCAEAQLISLNDVIFEVTETSMSDDMEAVISNLNQLASTGCRMALDDYGTGYSSLAYLSRMPIQELKIDRSFIGQMQRNTSDYRIVENTVKLARALQIQTVAEGVENENTLGTVTRLGCDRVQGYYLAKPMSLTLFDDWLMKRAG
ncbi:EAL domain-containing protein [Ketobacter sp.]